MMNFKEGEIIAIDKPYGMSSFGALAHIRFLCSKKQGSKVKMGHAGTLDPLATGVLILCTGKKTKTIEELQAHTKEYTATLQLGATTASFDREHEVDGTYPTDHITHDGIVQVLSTFVGPTEFFVSGNTLQLKDYSKTDWQWTLFDPEAKMKRHEEVFPKECERVFEMGRQLCQKTL